MARLKEEKYSGAASIMRFYSAGYHANSLLYLFINAAT